jgi:isopentenyldiphosphate isomerase
MMFYIFLVHTALVFYSAFYLSKEAWAFISGGLFYLLFGLYFLIEFARLKFFKPKIKEEEVEWLPVVDDQGKILGKISRDDAHKGGKILHPVVHLHVFGPNKTLLLQKRPMSKPIQPGKWDSSVGGHISFGESLETALRREAEEEIGLKDFSAKLLKVYRWDTEVESEQVYLFITRDHKSACMVNPEEVEEIRYWTSKEIERNLGKNIFTPNLEFEFSILKQTQVI